MSERRSSPLDALGLDVSVTNESLGDNKFLSRMLKDMGQTIKPAEHEYVGSFCSHIYKTELGKTVSYAHHHHFEAAVAETLVSMAVSDLAVHLMRVLFKRKKLSTLDKRDKRTNIDL